jgi:hypothetical protein
VELERLGHSSMQESFPWDKKKIDKTIWR